MIRRPPRYNLTNPSCPDTTLFRAAEGEHDGEDDGYRENRMDAQGAEVPRQVAAHDDELALGQVLHVHHAPHQGEAVGGKHEDRADEEAVQRQLHVESRRQRQQIDIIEHRSPSPNLSRRRGSKTAPARIGTGAAQGRNLSTSPRVATAAYAKRTSTAPPRCTRRPDRKSTRLNSSH